MAKEQPENPSSGDTTPTECIWFLSQQLTAPEGAQHVALHDSPFSVGRQPDCGLCLPRRTVSSRHAEFALQGNTLWITDLGSTNGTFVNGKRIHGRMELKHDDLLHFADVVYRVQRQLVDEVSLTTREEVCDRAMALVLFDKLMSERAVIPYFQPIVSLDGSDCLGYEVLGRSRVMGLETAPAMFGAAAQMNLEVELSRMLRWEGIQAVDVLAIAPELFVNTHPLELSGSGLLESLIGIRDLRPDQRITLEIHESAVTSAQSMRKLKSQLMELDIRLAYDDFGAGQARLIELVEVCPDFLKFDISLIRDIDQAGPQRQQMIGTLVRMSHDLGVVPLAEGIETRAEADTCSQLGFELGQGFFFGRPLPVRNDDSAPYIPAPQTGAAV